MKAITTSVLMAATAVPSSPTKVNIKTVQDNYARFLKGDIPGILKTFAHDSLWIHPGDTSLVPFAGTFLATDGIGRFFELVAESIQIKVFEPSNYRAEGTRVINEMHTEGIVPGTGKSYVYKGIYSWEFDNKGKAIRWEAKGDVRSLENAFRK